MKYPNIDIKKVISSKPTWKEYFNFLISLGYRSSYVFENEDKFKSQHKGIVNGNISI